MQNYYNLTNASLKKVKCCCTNKEWKYKTLNYTRYFINILRLSVTYAFFISNWKYIEFSKLISPKNITKKFKIDNIGNQTIN